jgi:type II secretory pathway component PulF
LLRQLRSRVQEGTSLSEAMAEHPRVFSIMYVRLVRVGETGGILDAVLAQLSEMLDRQIELRERVKTASVYPAVVFLLGLVSVTIIVTVIVPRIVESVGADGAQLPWPTRVLMDASHFVVGWWWLLGPAIVGAVLGFRQYVLRGPGRSWWDSFKLRMPIVGRLIRQLEAARLARSLGALLRGGVTVTEALRVTRDTVQNSRFREAVDGLMESIHAGESIARPLQRAELFPPLLVQMVRVGESTGRLDEMLLRSAVVHEGEARVTLDRFVTVLPVAMILVLACVIGFIVAALVLAIMEFQTTGFGALAR